MLRLSCWEATARRCVAAARLRREGAAGPTVLEEKVPHSMAQQRVPGCAVSCGMSAQEPLDGHSLAGSSKPTSIR